MSYQEEWEIRDCLTECLTKGGNDTPGAVFPGFSSGRRCRNVSPVSDSIYTVWELSIVIVLQGLVWLSDKTRLHSVLSPPFVVLMAGLSSTARLQGDWSSAVIGETDRSLINRPSWGRVDFDLSKHHIWSSKELQRKSVPCRVVCLSIYNQSGRI